MVLLCASLAVGSCKGKEEWEIIEFFSGVGRISTLAAKAKIPVASFEISRGAKPKRKKMPKNRSYPSRNSMDFNGESGFAPLDFEILKVFDVFDLLPRCFFLLARFHSLTAQPSKQRLAVLLILQSAFGKLVAILAPPCSTWISINCGTSKRTIITPSGDETYLQNRKANKLATRTGFRYTWLDLVSTC